MDEMIRVFTPIVRDNLQRPNVEIEFRLGKVNRSGGFDANVGPETFQKVILGLNKYDGWESKTMTKSEVYYGEGGRRAIWYEASDVTDNHIKTKIINKDIVLGDLPFDVRLGISTEVPCEQGDEFESSKERIRYSYLRKGLTIDATIMRGTPDDPDSETDVTYHVELEISDLGTIRSDGDIWRHMNKIIDVMNVITS
jgi:mRNA capping enzyme, beta chain